MKLFIISIALVAASLCAAAQTYVITATQLGKQLGTIEFNLLPEVAPMHAAFVAARITEGFYNGSAFHRVIPNFMIQGGDPNSINGPKSTWGAGGYKERVPAEFNSRKHLRGIISAARTNDTNSFNGQFFICVASAPWLDRQYTVFGEVTSGMNVVDQIVAMPRDGADNPINKVSMTISAKTTSVQESAMAQQLAIHPQPARDVLTVTAPTASTLVLMTVNGVAVQSETLPEGTSSVDIHNLPCGVYVAQCESATGTTYQPLIVSDK